MAFSDFQYGFRSSQSTPDLLTVVSDRIARAFNRSGATLAVAFDISMALIGFGMLVYSTDISLMECQVRYLALFLLFSVTDGFEWFWMESIHKNIQLMLEFLNAPFLRYINDLPDDVICDNAIYADHTTLSSKCDQASDLWQQLELASELEFDLRDTVDWGKKWLVDFNAGKTQLVLFNRSNNNGSTDNKMDGSVLKNKSCFKILGLTFSYKLDWSSYNISIAKTAS